MLPWASDNQIANGGKPALQSGEERRRFFVRSSKMSIDETKNLPEGQDKAPTTKPMLEAILAKVDDGFTAMNTRFAGMDGRFDKVEARLEKIETRLEKIEKEIRDVKRTQRTVNDHLLDLQGGYRELDERVGDLESKTP
jgi:archaellum component FlaC